jgi:RNase H-like domain found in reverse transcriptase
MTTNASNTHTEGSLYQTRNIKNLQNIDDKSNDMRLFEPLRFFTKALTTAQINYSTVDKELDAIIYALKFFRGVISSNKNKIQIFTDNRNISNWDHF